MSRSRLPSLLGCLLLGAACSHGLPTDPVVPCGSDGSCPTGFLCTSDQTCWKLPTPPASPPDSGTSANGPDAGAPGSDAGPAVPDVPTGLQAQRASGSITVSWLPSARATTYWLQRGTQHLGPYATVASTSATSYIDYVPDSVAYYYVVSAGNAAGNSATSSEVYVAANIPAPAMPSNPYAYGGGRKATLSWYESYSTVALRIEIRRAIAAGGPYDPIASMDASGFGSYVDTGLADRTRYYYGLRAVTDGGASDWTPDVSATTGPPPPAHLRVVPSNVIGYAMVAWDPVPGAAWYSLVTDPGAYTFVGQITQTQASVGGTGDATYGVSVKAFDPGGTEGALSPAIRVTMPPVAPAVVNASVDGVHATLTWSPVASATGYRIYRGGTSTFPLPQVGTSAVASFEEDLPQPWTWSRYGVAAENGNGLSPYQTSAPVYGTTPPDQANSGSGTILPVALDPAHVPGQTLTIAQGGYLAAVEISAARATNPAVSLTLEVLEGDAVLAQVIALPPLAATCCAALDPSRPGGDLLRLIDVLPAGLPVSAGEVLRLRLLPQAAMQLGASADSYPGGELWSGGDPDGTKDLLFKSYVRPVADPPSAVQGVTATGLVRAARIRWTATPGATSYSVARWSGTGDPVEVGTTAQPSIVDRGIDPGAQYAYAVHATDDTVTTPPAWIVGGALAADVDQSNRGDSGGGSILVDSRVGHVAQTFTVGRSGTLAGIQLSAVADALGQPQTWSTLTLYDVATNQLLAGVVPMLSLEGCCTPHAIGADVPARAYYDTSFAHVSVVAGQVLRFELTSNFPIQVADGPDLYPGGTEVVDGVPVPDRDLFFEVLVQ